MYAPRSLCRLDRLYFLVRSYWVGEKMIQGDREALSASDFLPRQVVSSVLDIAGQPGNEIADTYTQM
jgi:hypothetical protein